MSSAPSTVDEPRADERTLRHAGYSGVRRQLGPVRFWALVCLTLDGSMIALASVAARIGAGAAHSGALSLTWDGVFGALVIGILASRGLYRHGLWTKPLDDLIRVAVAAACAAMTVITARLLTGGDATVADPAVREAAF